MTVYLNQQPIAEWVLRPVDRALAAAAASPGHASLPGGVEDGPAMLLAEVAQCLLQQSALAIRPQLFKASAPGLLEA